MHLYTGRYDIIEGNAFSEKCYDFLTDNNIPHLIQMVDHIDGDFLMIIQFKNKDDLVKFQLGCL